MGEQKMEANRESNRLASFLSANCSSLKCPGLKSVSSLQKSNGVKSKGLLTVAKHLTRESSRSDLLGSSKEEEAFVNQWLEYRVLNLDRCSNDRDIQNVLKELNNFLSDKGYLVGNRLTLADVILYFGLHSAFNNMTFYDKEQFLNVSRWFDQVQHTPSLRQDLDKIFFQKTIIYTKGCTH